MIAGKLKIAKESEAAFFQFNWINFDIAINGTECFTSSPAENQAERALSYARELNLWVGNHHSHQYCIGTVLLTLRPFLDSNQQLLEFKYHVFLSRSCSFYFFSREKCGLYSRVAFVVLVAMLRKVK